MPFKPRQTDETIRAWKRAAVDLMIDDGNDDFRPILVGPITGRLLTVDYGTALCLPFGRASALHSVHGSHPEEPPVVGCTCGFYAVNDRRDLDGPLDSGVATLEVELFGRVVRHERGYRAQRQRVLSVTLDRTCHLCLDTIATRIAVGGDLWRVPFAGLFVSGSQRQWCVAICDECLNDHEPAATFTAGELANALRTEVRWAAAA